jgi:molybdopterin-binding protein
LPLFMSIHTLPPGGFTAARIEEIARAGQEDPVVRGYRSFHSLSEGRIVWLLEAPNKEAVAAWCEKVGLPLDGVTQLELEGHVGVIRKVETTFPNQIQGRVTNLVSDTGVVLVHVTTAGGQIDALVDAATIESMQLAVGDSVAVLFKAMNVSLAIPSPKESAMKLSFPNQIQGKVTSIIKSTTLVIVHIDTAAGQVVAAIIPSAAESISLEVGDEVTALFKALDVSLAKG